MAMIRENLKQRKQSQWIGLYRKTQHFMLRQKEWNVSDELLGGILERIKCSLGVKTAVIVGEHFLKSHIYKVGASNLVLLIDGNDLVTIYPTRNLFVHSYERVLFVQ